MSKGEKPILSVRVSADVLERVDRLAELAGVGRAEVVERCLWLGVANQEEFVKLLQSPVRGPLEQFLTHPWLLRKVYQLLGEELETDPTSMKLREQAVKRRKGKGKAKPATE